jgi:hypothetical protein
MGGLVTALAGTRTPLQYPEVREIALQAEALGLDTIWLYDPLIYRSPRQGTRGIWECWTILAALVEATEHITLGTLALCTQFRNPALNMGRSISQAGITRHATMRLCLVGRVGVGRRCSWADSAHGYCA